ncbi:uncharacterized protein LOC124776590 [Schistocerca piceifrons]|uniref:uncharacterized protein LOC124776590 n=1 Tax=Schistocerca piceifrons TaxID=274613 RepID=UPI001F5FD760|nr:uncharacterized protein LOC124776590 [Schistocerca piceifrons]
MSGMCQLKALSLAKELGISSFKASRGWLSRFFNRNGLGFRRKTTIAQWLPGDYEEKIVNFHCYVINLHRKQSYILLEQSTDQTPVYFEMLLDNTVNRKEEFSIMIRTGGSEEQRCTVMLCVTGDGQKLPHYITFKRKTILKICGWTLNL